MTRVTIRREPRTALTLLDVSSDDTGTLTDTATVSDGSLLLESTWSYGTGQTTAVLTDNYKFWSDGDFEGNAVNLGPWDSCTASIVSGASCGWTGSGNVFRIERKAGWAHCCACHDTNGPYFPTPTAGAYWAARFYVMNGTGQVQAEQHPHCFWGAGNIEGVHCAIYTNQTSGGDWNIAFMIDTAVPSRSWNLWLANASAGVTRAVLTANTWYRYEWIMHWLTNHTFRIYPRLYDMSGTLLYDADSWRESDGPFLTCNAYYAAGGYFDIGDDDTSRERVRYFTVGNGQSGNYPGTYYYVADLALKMATSTTDFIGP